MPGAGKGKGWGMGKGANDQSASANPTPKRGCSVAARGRAQTSRSTSNPVNTVQNKGAAGAPAPAGQHAAAAGSWRLADAMMVFVALFLAWSAGVDQVRQQPAQQQPPQGPPRGPPPSPPSPPGRLSPEAWNRVSERMQVSGAGLVVSKTNRSGYRLANSGAELTAGLHTWEVVLTADTKDDYRYMMVGVARPGLNLEIGQHDRAGMAWYLSTGTGGLCGGGEAYSKRQGKVPLGTRVGVRLDLDDGSMRFYNDGHLFGPGFPPGTVTGPVVRAVELADLGQQVTLIPDAQLELWGV